MKVRKFEIVQNKMGLKGCTWSSLNAPGTETHQNHLYWKLEEFPFHLFLYVPSADENVEPGFALRTSVPISNTV